MKRVLGLIFMIVGLLVLGDVIWESDIVDWLSSRSTLEKSLPVEHIDFIQVNTSSVNVEVVPSDQDQLKAVLAGRDTNDVRFQVERDLYDGRINVEKKWYVLFSDPYQLKLFVFVPKHLQPSIEINSTTGNVRIGGAKGATWSLDKLETNVNSGNCELMNIKLNKWRHDGTSGNLTVDRVNAKETRLDKISGNVELSHFTGAIDVSLTSGNVKMQLDQLAGDIKTDLTSGNLSINLPQEVAFTLKTKIASGEVKSSFPLVWKKKTEETTTATYGIGKYQIQVETMSGNLTIY